jgi:2',3'-cyclic-nucleotide 2'-phosphodiesterase (5'-nucleotidase family)
MVTQAGYYLKYLGMLSIVMEKNKIISIKDSLISLKGYSKTDSLLVRKVAQYNNNEQLKKTAGYLGTALKGESELGYFMAFATWQSSKADFAFQNSGGIRVQELSQGLITLKQVYELDPFSNEIVICKMTPAQIRELIIYGYKKEKKADLISAGINSEIYLNPDKSVSKVELFLPDGSKPDEQKVYLVALNSYVASAYKFSRSGEPSGTGITTTEALLKMLSQVKSFNFSGNTSSKLIETK